MTECIYVAKGQGGLLKVGRTKDPVRRRLTLRKEFRSKGDRLLLFSPCPPTKNAYYAEVQLIRLIGERLASHSGREWFYGGSFENVERAAREISQHVDDTHVPFVLPSAEESARYRAQRLAARALRAEQGRAFQRLKQERRAIRIFRATVCERIAASLLAVPAEASEPR